MPKSVALLVGSLRKASFSRKTAHALAELARPDLALDIVEIGDLPLYNEDEEADAPASWRRFRDEVRPCQAVLFVTPEYNRSVPGAMKNAIDVGSRPYGKSVWSGKPGAVISVSPGAIGGFGANHALRQSMVFLDVPMMAQPEAYIAGAHKLFDAEGALIDETAGLPDQVHRRLRRLDRKNSCAPRDEDDHSHAGHHRHPGPGEALGRAFAIGVTLNLAYVVVEIVFGIIAHSLALLADAGHNFGDVLALALAWLAQGLARRAPSGRYTYGLRGSTSLAALANAVLLLLVTGAIGWQALQRLLAPAASRPAR